MQGNTYNPSILGGLRAESGHIFYLDRKFELDRLLISFNDPYKIDPEISLSAYSEVTDIDGTAYTITLTLEGRALGPEFKLVSSPELGTIDIVSLIMLGTTTQGMSAEELGVSGVLSTRAQDIANKLVLRLAASQMERILKADRIYIESDIFEPSSLSETRIRVEKKVGRINVSYSFVVGDSADQEVKLGYELTKNIFVETSTDRAGNSGIDLRLKYKFD